MLGELYQPKGLALETARFVLEVENVYACNVARGCVHNCAYCYGPISAHVKRDEWFQVKQPSMAVKKLIEQQMVKGFNPKLEGVFFSFLTDPLIMPNYRNTVDALGFLAKKGVRTATLSKATVPPWGIANTRSGMTVVSLDREFGKLWEAGAYPANGRLDVLKSVDYPWVSMEPYPPSSIWQQDFGEFIENFKFAKAIVFGMWNYDPRSRTEQAREEYRDVVVALEQFCQTHKIRCHVKSETQAFIDGKGT